MAGEENQTQQTTGVDVNAIINAAMANAGTVGTTGQGSVYLGTKTTTVPGVIARPGAKAEKIPDVKTIAQANSLYLNDPRIRANWSKTMRKYGLETGNPLVERRAWETAVAGASDWYVTSNQTAKITPEQYLQWWAGGQKKAAQVPTRQIYNVRPEQIDADVNDIAIQRLGRQLTDTDRQADWYKDLLNSVQKMYRAGVVSEPGKLVKNKKTGKMERLVQQIPEFSKEGVTAAITEAVEAADPISAERKKNLDFADWAMKKMGGNR